MDGRGPFHPAPGADADGDPTSQHPEQEGRCECATPRPAAAAVLSRPNRAYYYGVDEESRLAGWPVFMARNLARDLLYLHLHVAGRPVVLGPSSGEFERSTYLV